MNPRRTIGSFRSLFPAALLSVSGLALAPAASAQDALGSGDALGGGNALDANPLEGSGGANPLSRDWNSELAFRNAIVTGNVGGGRQFRGNLGYSGIGDFRGSLGSDLLYNFERDTFYSGLAARKVRGIDATALQMQGPLAGLRGGPSGLSGGLIINRPGSGTTSMQINQPDSTPQNTLSELMAFDRVNNTLRSTSAFTVRNAVRPRVVGSASDGTNEYYLTASPLGGVDALSPLDPALVTGRSYSPEQFDFDPRISIPGYREQALRDRRLLDEIEDSEQIAQRMPGHARILDDLRDRAVRRGLISSDDLKPGSESRPGLRPDGRDPADPDEPTGTPGLEFPDFQGGSPDSILNNGSGSEREPGPDTTVDELDRLLRGFSRDLESRPGGFDPIDPDRAMGNPLDGPPELGPTRLRRTEDPTRDDPATIDDRLNEQTMDRMIALLREQRTTIDRIAPTGGDSLYAQHMRAGERLLADGMWFIAEERFVAALSANSGDAMAAIGRAHAQIGAGLYLSAAVNLSDLMRAYPELTNVRYERRLLPGSERLGRIRQQLRSRSVDDDANARNAGFLLAYLGFQTDRARDIREGFAVIERVNEALDLETDPLMGVLAELWLADEEEDAEDPEAEPQP